MSQDEKLEPGDVIQINPEKNPNPLFAGLLAMVDEVKPWGCIAFVHTFAVGRDEGSGRAYIRLQIGDFARIGPAPFVPYDIELDRQAGGENAPN